MKTALAKIERNDSIWLRFALGSGEIRGRGEPRMVVFENRSAANIFVHEHRKRRKTPFAGRHGVNIDRP
ncbi:hypothetical protein C7476_113126 [Phyllobacterium bourgognense]|uniref:Uncharacterized protein n=1 Tax=Phyllobacterium bourgognense TaxID=314236 RepID=A0A368YK87_9HYPH|nr:hypothetical protein C7476_113126 [Phyllobacterium bourgognense]